MKRNQRIFNFFSIAIVALLLFNCSDEIQEDNTILNELNLDEDGLSTVPLDNTLDLFSSLNENNKSNKNQNNIDLKIDLESLKQVEISNSDAKLNIANATTQFDNVETQVLQIEIEGTIQTVLFHHVPDDKSTSNKTASSGFTGAVYTTNLSGIVLSGFNMNSGSILGSFNFLTGSYSSGTQPCWGIACGIPLNEVVVTGNAPSNTNWAWTNYANTANVMMNYQFVRSSNNYSSMGTAYANYYRGKAIRDFDEQIDDKNLDKCLQDIIKKLKTVSSSPGNMVAKFSGNFPGYNWEVKSGSLSGETARTDAPTNYNAQTGTMTTTFDSQGWSNATNLSWARTLIHESIHAYLAASYKINRPNYIATYPQMVQDWGIKQNWNDVHHEEIARSLVSLVGAALESYGKNEGYTLSNQFYEDMAWAGLQDTSTFKALPSADQKRILDTISVELTGNDVNGNSKTQKGKKAGC